jgi:hypothetical protein
MVRRERGRKGLEGQMVGCFRAVDTAEVDTFRAVVAEDFEGVAVEDGNDGAVTLQCFL